MKDTSRGNFITRDHRYVYLGGSMAALLGLSLWDTAPNPYSFIGADSPLGVVMAAVCLLFLAIGAVALIVKWTHWNTYDSTFIKRPAIVKGSRYLSYLVFISCFLFVLDRWILNLIYHIKYYANADSNPQNFFGGLVYMASRNGSTFLTGVWTTVRLALFGTAIAFVLSILMVFMRIQVPDKRDNDFVKLIKFIANKFASLYIFVIRGTPMMVQSLIFYYAIFNLFKKTGMSVTEINRIWSFFISGLVTISLNSTAYLAEVLRGGIMAIDAGQMEAARSLGMTQWQAMVKVVFPQAVKNSIPAIGNEFIINIKDSSVLSVLGVSDLMFQTKGIVGIYYRDLEMYVVAAGLYLILTYLSSLLLKAVAKKMENSDVNNPQGKSRKPDSAMPDYGIPSSN
jgi:putative lysine transport system permease protein